MTAATGARWRVDIPASWTPCRAPDLVVAAVAPDPRGGVVAHVTVGRERLPVAVGLDAVCDRATHELAELADDDIVELGSSRADDGTLERRTLVVTFSPRRTAVDVAQVIAFVSPICPDADGARDVLQVVGTCALDELERYAPAFADVVESIHLVA